MIVIVHQLIKVQGIRVKVGGLVSLHCCSTTGVVPEDTMRKAFDKFSLDNNTVDFIGHALCLYRDDEYVGVGGYIEASLLILFFSSYITKPMRATIERIKLYS